MDTETKVDIISLLEADGPLSSLRISNKLMIDKAEVYSFLTRCEKKHIVKRGMGIEPDKTLTFAWTLLTTQTGDLSAI